MTSLNFFAFPSFSHKLHQSKFIVCFLAALLFGLMMGTGAEASEQLAVEHQSVVNINTASAEELAGAMEGVGESKAQAIVAYRKANGSFSSVNDLVNVKGIGEATVMKNKSRITL